MLAALLNIDIPYLIEFVNQSNSGSKFLTDAFDLTEEIDKFVQKWEIEPNRIYDEFVQ